MRAQHGCATVWRRGTLTPLRYEGINDMRSVLGFFSMLAVGFLVAAWLAVIGSGPVAQFPNTAMHPGQGFTLDYGSVLLGLAIGLILPLFGRFSWADLPRRAIAWMLTNERNFYRAGMAAVLLGVLLFY